MQTFLGDISCEFLREFLVLCHFSERNLSGDFHDLALTCTRQRKHTSVDLIWQREDVQRAEH